MPPPCPTSSGPHGRVEVMDNPNSEAEADDKSLNRFYANDLALSIHELCH